MRRLSMVLLLVCSALVASALPARPQRRAENASPPGQVTVRTINARQQGVLDLTTFRRLFEFVQATRARPVAFDGGNAEATAMPDIIVFQEMRFSNLEIAERLLDQRSSFDYEIVSSEGAMTRFLVNVTTMAIVGDTQMITDPCRAGSGEAPAKRYLLARFTENATGAPVVVVGVHFKAKYFETGQDGCRERNIDAIRAALATETAPIIIGGDFNSRSVEVPLECDPDERSTPFGWWTYMTSPPAGSRPFTDAVLATHRAHGEVMTHEWTFERHQPVTFCHGDEGPFKRSRLDYFFTSGVVVASAHADHPGWAGAIPGARNPDNPKYSDHRWVAGRFVLTGPPQPSRPAATTGAGGVIDVTWEAAEGVTGWVLYRGSGRRLYQPVGAFGSDVKSYHDTETSNGVRYRYAVAPVGIDGGQGLESAPVTAVADARGPQVIGRRPPAGGRQVSRNATVHVFYDEAIEPASVTGETIAVYRKGSLVRGVVRQVSGSHLIFDPRSRWRKNSRFVVVVRPVTDVLGNRGTRESFSFET